LGSLKEKVSETQKELSNLLDNVRTVYDKGNIHFTEIYRLKDSQDALFKEVVEISLKLKHFEDTYKELSDYINSRINAIVSDNQAIREIVKNVIADHKKNKERLGYLSRKTLGEPYTPDDYSISAKVRMLEERMGKLEENILKHEKKNEFEITKCRRTSGIILKRLSKLEVAIKTIENNKGFWYRVKKLLKPFFKVFLEVLNAVLKATIFRLLLALAVALGVAVEFQEVIELIIKDLF
jgi:chromosome segregation ATPase